MPGPSSSEGDGSAARPHLLYIAFFYPPSRSSGVYRAHATVKSFIRRGWDVTVITTDEGFFDRATGSSDWSLVDEIPDEANIVRVPFDLESTRKKIDLRKLNWFQGNFHWLTSRLSRPFRPLTMLADVLAGRHQMAFDLLDRYVAWIDPVVRAGRKVASERPVDAILATGNPFSSFEAARLLSAMVEAPYAIDYRDPWALNVMTGEVVDRPRRTVEAERRIVTDASFAVFVNEATIDLYTAIFPEMAGKCLTIFNGYDETSLGRHLEQSNGDLRFGMLGTATNLWPLEEFFEAWNRERDAIDGRVVLGGYLGYFAWSASPLEDVFPTEEEGFEYLGPIPKTEVGEFYDSLDVIVVLLFGGPIITAGKMYESAAQAKPILCVQPAGGGARQVFETHPYAVCVDPDPDEIAEGLRRVAELARTIPDEDRRRVRIEMEKYERLNELDRLVERFDELIGS